MQKLIALPQRYSLAYFSLLLLKNGLQGHYKRFLHRDRSYADASKKIFECYYRLSSQSSVLTSKAFAAAALE